MWIDAKAPRPIPSVITMPAVRAKWVLIRRRNRCGSSPNTALTNGDPHRSMSCTKNGSTSSRPITCSGSPTVRSKTLRSMAEMCMGNTKTSMGKSRENSHKARFHESVFPSCDGSVSASNGRMRMARRQGQYRLIAVITSTPTNEQSGVSQPRKTPSGNVSDVCFTKAVRIPHPDSKPISQPKKAMTAPSSITTCETCFAVIPAARKSASMRIF